MGLLGGNFRAHSLKVGWGGGVTIEALLPECRGDTLSFYSFTLACDLFRFLFMCLLGFCCKRAFLFNRVILSPSLLPIPLPFSPCHSVSILLPSCLSVFSGNNGVRCTCFSVHASGSESQELKDLQEMLRSQDITPAEKQSVQC